VQITDPSAITSLSTGASLQNVLSSINLPIVDYYSPSDSTESPTNFPSKFAIIIMLILYALTFIWSDTMVQPIQFMQVLFFHSMINVQVPANIYYFLLELKLSVFDFVTNWFSPYFDDKSVYWDTSIKLANIFVDYIFLRNLGQIFVFIAIFAILWLIFAILSRK